MLLHLPAALDRFTFARCFDLKLLKRWQDFLSHFLVLNCFSGFYCHNLIEFAGGVFAWRGEILSEDDLSGDSLAVDFFKLALVLFSHALVDLLWSLGIGLAKFGQ